MTGAPRQLRLHLRHDDVRPPIKHAQVAALVRHDSITLTYAGSPAMATLWNRAVKGKRVWMLWTGHPARIPDVVRPRDGCPGLAEASYPRPPQGRGATVPTTSDARQQEER